MIALAILISSINLPAMLRQSYPLDVNFQIGIQMDNFYERFPTIKLLPLPELPTFHQQGCSIVPAKQ